ncbi:MAG: flagellar export protein FliJ [Desulfovibrionaceae bacterium]|nr:flagellar export protein FliJ [Desulfovibrionaceae bacterium]
MSFQFRMQKILDYREQLEEEAKISFANAKARVDQAQSHVTTIQDKLEEAVQKSQANPLMSAAEFWVNDNYIRGLQDDLEAALMQLKIAEEVRKEAQKLLTLRAIDKKMLVKLKERQHATWIHEEKLKEQHFNDEIATIRYKKAPAC